MSDPTDAPTLRERHAAAYAEWCAQKRSEVLMRVLLERVPVSKGRP